MTKVAVKPESININGQRLHMGFIPETIPNRRSHYSQTFGLRRNKKPEATTGEERERISRTCYRIPSQRSPLFACGTLNFVPIVAVNNQARSFAHTETVTPMKAIVVLKVVWYLDCASLDQGDEIVVSKKNDLGRLERIVGYDARA